MHSLRSSVLLARLLLVWFALTLGVAGASPFINPQSMELVCSTGGEVKLVVTQGSNDDEGSKAQALGLHTLDCSLCLATMLPPAQISTEFAKAAPADVPHVNLTTVHVRALAGAPLPPRGPPVV